MKRQKSIWKRFAAMILVIVMILTIAPTTAFARTDGTGIRNGVETVADETAAAQEPAAVEETAAAEPGVPETAAETAALQPEEEIPVAAAEAVTEAETPEPEPAEVETITAEAAETETIQAVVTSEAETIAAETTEAVTTEAVTTEAETTEAVATEAETTAVETTEAETTETETTEAEATEAEMTAAETTEAETTEAETTEPETTEAETTEAETTEAETPAAMPAVTLRARANGVNVTVNAPEGAFPAGTTMAAHTVNDEAVLDQIRSTVDEYVYSISAVDIIFYNAAGAEIEPQVPIRVTLTSGAVDEESSVLVHVPDEGEAEVVGNVEIIGNRAEFTSDEFSVYAVVEIGTDARVHIVFQNGDDPAPSIYVKEADTADADILAQVLYDPGLDELEDGVFFQGWTTDPDYTTSTAPMSIDDIRAYFAGTGDYSGSGFDWDADDFRDGYLVTFYPMLFRQYTVTYLDMNGASLGQHVVNYLASQSAGTEMAYTVNMPYHPADDWHDFQGWFVRTGSGDHIVGYDPAANDGQGTIYQNSTAVRITGDVVFTVNAPEGHWLIFNENGRGGTYTAPQFVLSNSVTVNPDEEGSNRMQRLGYTFGGWYDTAAHADAHAADPENVTEGEFTFGGALQETTEIFASWIPNATANFTVLFYEERLTPVEGEDEDESNYEFITSYTGTGNVGDSIIEDYIGVETIGDMQYVMINGQQFGGIQSVPYGTQTPRFTGLTYDHAGDDQTITADGNAVVRVYFNRMTYTLRFYVTRTNRRGDGEYRGSAAYGDTYSGNWNTNLSRMTRVFNNAPTSNSYVESGNQRYYYVTLSARYGESISARWPSRADVNSSTDFVSWLLMSTAKGFRQVGSGGDTVKGPVSFMNEQILGDLTRSSGNYVTARYSGGASEWTYNIYLANADGTYPQRPSHTFSVFSQSAASGQTAPAYDGYVLDRTTNSGNTMNFYLRRDVYTITYMDGRYIDGRGNLILDRSSHPFTNPAPAENVVYGSDITGYNVTPNLPAGQVGYVFEGWYSDAACTHEYDFDTMPLGDLLVYAKWRQIEYRVFLHPNMPFYPEDSEAVWGSDSVSFTFRVGYDGTISTPTGRLDGYEFGGWFFDDGTFNEPFNERAFRLNATNLPAANPRFSYDKTDPANYTDPMDQYGRITGAGWNSDVWDQETQQAIERPWITQSVNLYAMWRSTLNGADGIRVIYDLNREPAQGETAPEDNNQYVDRARASAAPAVDGYTAEDSVTGEQTDYVFDHWVMQRWTGNGYVDVAETDEGYQIFPGDRYQVLASNAHVEPVLDDNGDPVYRTNEAGDPVDSNGNPTDDPEEWIPLNTYTIQLRAEYVPVEEATRTFIPWFKNDGTAAFHIDTLGQGVTDVTQSSLIINEAVSIQAPPARPGYTFIGWARVDMSDISAASYDSAAEAMAAAAVQARAFMSDTSQRTKSGLTPFLYYNSADGTFHTGSTFTDANAVTQVAADEALQYQAIFGVWEEEDVTINYAVASDSTGRGTVSPASETIPAATGTAGGSTATASSVSYVFDYWTCDDGTEHVGDTAAFVPSRNSDGIYEEHTYYAHFKLNTAPVTVHHYLTGTTTRVANDVVTTATVGSTFTAEAAAEFLEAYRNAGLTVKSYSPSQTITVAAGTNTVTVYYNVPVTVAATTAERVYNGNPLNGGYTIEGALNETDKAAILAALPEAPSITHVADSPAEYLTETDQAAITGIPGYYDVTYTPGTLTITPAELTITTQSGEKPYDGSALTAEGSIAGFVTPTGGAQETASFTVTGSQTPVGSSANTYKLLWNGTAVKTDYTLSENLGTLRVTPNTTELTIASSTKSWTYDGNAHTDHVYTVTYGGTSSTAAAGEDGTYTCTLSTGDVITITPDESAVVTTVTEGAVANAFDYTLTNAGFYSNVRKTEGDLSIVPAVLTIEALPQDYMYNGETQGPGDAVFTDPDEIAEVVIVTGLQGTDELTSIKVDGQGVDADVYELVPSGALIGTNGARNENYEIRYVKAALTIEPRNVILTSGTASKVYDRTPLTNDEVTVGGDGFVGSDGAVYDVFGSQTEVGSSENTFSYTLNEGTVPANYNIEQVFGTLTVTQEPNPSLNVEKTTTSTPANGENYVLGEEITYQIVVTNDGNLVITNVVVTDELTGDEWTIEALEPGADETFTASHTVTEDDVQAGSVVNVATADGENESDVPTDPGSGDTEDPTGPDGPEPPEPNPSLNVEKTTTSTPANGENYVLGEEITYQIVVTNDGNLTITNVVVTDELTGDEWIIEALEPGADETFTASYTVTEDDVLAGSVVNVATADGENESDVPTDPGTGETEDPTEEPASGLSVEKTITSTAPENGYDVGDEIAYQVVVKNTSNVTISDITVADSLVTLSEPAFTLAPGETKTITYRYTVTQADVNAGSVTNTATARGTDPNGGTPIGGDTVTTDDLASVRYAFTQGMGQTWWKGSGVTADFEVTRYPNDEPCFRLFTGIEIDGQAVDRSMYRAEEGCVELYFSVEYMESLALGRHTIRATFEDGFADTYFFVKMNVPAQAGVLTGDNLHYAGWAAGLLGSAAVIAAAGSVALKRRKREDED